MACPRARLLLVLVCCLLGPDLKGADEANAKERLLTVPVHYTDQIIIVVRGRSVAAIRFADAIEDGRAYKYRLLPRKGDREQSGEGKVFEKYESHQEKEGSKRVEIVDRGSQLMITVGAVSLEWSHGSDTSGWVYFVPERERVYLVWADAFDTVDLARFAE